MKVRLKCDDSIYNKTLEELKSCGIEVTNDAEWVLKHNRYESNKVSVLTKRDQLKLIHHKEILYFYSIQDSLFVVTNDDEYIIKDKLYKLENKYSEYGFTRVSKSHLVNIEHIDLIEPYFNSKYVLIMNNGDNVDVNRHYLKNFRKYLGL